MTCCSPPRAVPIGPSQAVGMAARGRLIYSSSGSILLRLNNDGRLFDDRSAVYLCRITKQDSGHPLWPDPDQSPGAENQGFGLNTSGRDESPGLRKNCRRQEQPAAIAGLRSTYQVRRRSLQDYGPGPRVREAWRRTRSWRRRAGGFSTAPPRRFE